MTLTRRSLDHAGPVEQVAKEIVTTGSGVLHIVADALTTLGASMAEADDR